MDEAQKATAAAWIGSHINPSCPSCDHPGPFQIGEELVATPVVSAGFMSRAKSVPAVVLVCRHCQFMRFFSAVAMGLAPGDAPTATPGQPTGGIKPGG